MVEPRPNPGSFVAGLMGAILAMKRYAYDVPLTSVWSIAMEKISLLPFVERFSWKPTYALPVNGAAVLPNLGATSGVFRQFWTRPA